MSATICASVWLKIVLSAGPCAGIKEAVIAPGTPAYENWLSPGGAVYRQFWFFNVQNAREVVEEGRAPWTARARSASPEVHTDSQEENRGAYSKLPIVLHPVLERMIKSSNSSLFQQRSVRELLWGYKDPMLKATVGLFAPYNATFDGYYTVYTGEGDIGKVASCSLVFRSLPFWDDKYCNMINGTDGSNFAPFVDATKPIYFFSSDICRSVSANFEHSVELKEIPVYRFGLLPSTLASPVDNPDNHCYCRDPKTTKNCTMAGVLDISSCQDGQPIYISLPHFLHGTPSLHQAIKGLNPSEEHHKTYLDVEPITGITLGFAKRIQGVEENQRKHHFPFGLDERGNDTDAAARNLLGFFSTRPTFWFQTAQLDDDSASLLKEELVDRIKMLDVVQKVLLGAGLAVFALCLISYIAVRCNDESETGKT
uniref:CD36 molecule (CD36 blood group) n=1 Tax=Hippocampus comes TaxID=109280 RepID=A0A3Q2XMQ4_HIPCM